MEGGEDVEGTSRTGGEGEVEGEAEGEAKEAGGKAEGE